MEIPKTLALDFGTVRVGCAVSYGSLAEPLCIIGNSPEVFDKIAALLNEHRIQQVLVGVSEGASAQRARQFGQRVHEKTGLPVAYADETLSTQSARKKLREQKKIAPIVDHYAAAEFLQEWLDTTEF